MILIDYLRVGAILCWSGVILFCFRSIWILWHKPNDATPIDVFTALLGGCALMVVGFQARWYFAGTDSFFYVGLCIFAIVLGVGAMLVINNYQRQIKKSTKEIENRYDLA